MRYLTFSQLRAKLGGRARSSIYLDVEAGRLPPPIKLGGRLYWCETDVDERLRSASSAATQATASNGSAALGAATDDPGPARDTSQQRWRDRRSHQDDLGVRRARHSSSDGESTE